jgi:hypothetical protein
MTYKFSCPSCGTKVSRWRIFFEIVNTRCKGCGSRLAVTPLGWVVIFGVVALEILWYAVTRMRMISTYTGMIFVVVTCVLAIWYIPYLMPVRLASNEGARK